MNFVWRKDLGLQTVTLSGVLPSLMPVGVVAGVAGADIDFGPFAAAASAAALASSSCMVMASSKAFSASFSWAWRRLAVKTSRNL